MAQQVHPFCRALRRKNFWGKPLAVCERHQLPVFPFLFGLGFFFHFVFSNLFSFPILVFSPRRETRGGIPPGWVGGDPGQMQGKGETVYFYPFSRLFSPDSKYCTLQYVYEYTFCLPCSKQQATASAAAAEEIGGEKRKGGKGGVVPSSFFLFQLISPCCHHSSLFYFVFYFIFCIEDGNFSARVFFSLFFVFLPSLLCFFSFFLEPKKQPFFFFHGKGGTCSPLWWKCAHLFHAVIYFFSNMHYINEVRKILHGRESAHGGKRVGLKRCSSAVVGSCTDLPALFFSFFPLLSLSLSFSDIFLGALFFFYFLFKADGWNHSIQYEYGDRGHKFID